MNNSWLGYAVIVVLFLLFAGGVWLLFSMMQSESSSKQTSVEQEDEVEEVDVEVELTPKMFEEFIYSQ